MPPLPGRWPVRSQGPIEWEYLNEFFANHLVFSILWRRLNAADLEGNAVHDCQLGCFQRSAFLHVSEYHLPTQAEAVLCMGMRLGAPYNEKVLKPILSCVVAFVMFCFFVCLLELYVLYAL